MARYRYSQVVVPAISLKNVNLAAPGALPVLGDEFDIPSFFQGRANPKAISAEYFITGGPPTTITVEVQGSNDGTNWQTVGTANTNTGDVIYVSGRMFRMYRMAITALTGGAGTLTKAQFGVN